MGRLAFYTGLMRAMFRWSYGHRAHGLSEVAALPHGAILVAPHQSLFDGPLVGSLLPLDRAVGTMDAPNAAKPGVSWFVRLRGVRVLDYRHPWSVRALIADARAGGLCLIFPEGRLTPDGSLQAVRPGAGVIADRAGVPLVPVRIDGAEHLLVSRQGDRLKPRLLPRVSIRFLPPVTPRCPEGLRGRARRAVLAAQARRVMRDARALPSTDQPGDMVGTLLWQRDRLVKGRGGVDVAGRPSFCLDTLLKGAVALADPAWRGRRVALNAADAADLARAVIAVRWAGGVPVVGPGAAAMADLVLENGAPRAGVPSPGVPSPGVPSPGVPRPGVKAPWSWRRGRGRGPLAGPALIVAPGGGAPPLEFSEAALVARANRLAALWPLGVGDRLFSLWPLDHVCGVVDGLMAPLLAGMAVATPAPGDGLARAARALYDARAQGVWGPAAAMRALAAHVAPADLAEVRYAFAPRDPETAEAWAAATGRPLYGGLVDEAAGGLVALATPVANPPDGFGELLPRCDLVRRPDGVWLSGPDLPGGDVRLTRCVHLDDLGLVRMGEGPR